MNSSTSSSRDGSVQLEREQTPVSSVSMGGKVEETLVDAPTSSRTARSAGRPLYRRVAWGLLGVILLIVCSELFIFRNDDFYGKQPGFIGQFAELERSWRDAKPEEVTTAIFGDSMGMDGMRPRMLAGAAGISTDTIFNFSITGGKAYEINRTYLRYRDQMPNLRRVFIVVNEHQLNNTDVGTQPMFRYYAGLRDRFAVMNKDNYGELVLGWALKSWDMRSEWTTMVDKVLGRREGNLRDEIPAFPHGLEPVSGGTLTVEEGRATADRWFDRYNLEGILTDSFESLVRDLRERGVEVVILRLPRSELFESPARAHYAAEQQAFNAKVAAIADRYGAKFDIISNAELSTYSDFRDPNHVNEKGALWIARYVAGKWMQ